MGPRGTRRGRGGAQVVRMALDAGVSVFASDPKANTALLVAAREAKQHDTHLEVVKPHNTQHREVCQLLVDKGADAKVFNVDRNSAYDISVHDRNVALQRCLDPSKSDDGPSVTPHACLPSP